MGVKVKIGSPCKVKYMDKEYPAVIKKIRATTKKFLVEFERNGKILRIWRSALELSPASPFQEDAEPTVVRVFDKES